MICEIVNKSDKHSLEEVKCFPNRQILRHDDDDKDFCERVGFFLNSYLNSLSLTVPLAHAPFKIYNSVLN